ncbi:hypothetical protein Y032_0033g2745 [Ancylostoma ceylanicum]|uniref:PH domain protein n=2 Tax=Ancylostoma ceylanicum TaxID=53326 RepID=A0A016UNW1_9BILA|nr:hypothetical protein Y032_0033g2745 [Ancylostoma ceylanicum]
MKNPGSRENQGSKERERGSVGSSEGVGKGTSKITSSSEGTAKASQKIGTTEGGEAAQYRRKTGSLEEVRVNTPEQNRSLEGAKKMRGKASSVVKKEEGRRRGTSVQRGTPRDARKSTMSKTSVSESRGNTVTPSVTSAASAKRSKNKSFEEYPPYDDNTIASQRGHDSLSDESIISEEIEVIITDEHRDYVERMTIGKLSRAGLGQSFKWTKLEYYCVVISYALSLDTIAMFNYCVSRLGNHCSSDVVSTLGALVMKQRTTFSHSDGKDAFSSLSHSTSANLPVITFQQYVQSWSGKQIARWVEGLGDAMNPYLGTIRDNVRSGKHLHLIDDEMLANIGITALGPRKTILQAVQLLLYFCTEAPSENLQSLSMKVVIACKAVALELGKALRCRDEKPLTRNHVVAVLNSISLSMSVLVEHVKKLVFWLDRSPFDELVQYIELRNRVSVSIWDLVRSVNVQPKSLFGVASDIIQKTNDLRELCENVVRNSDDPAILYTAYVERALLRRHDVNTNWGINLQSSFRGVHVISEVKVGSPADLCCRIDAGDEIMLINGKTVVGWDLTRVAQRLGSSTDTELHLVLNKRPRHSLPLPLKNSAKPTRPLAKMIPGSQATDTADRGKRVFKEIAYPLNRRRSSTFVAELINLQSKGARIRATRRSSICGGSPRRELYFEEDERPYVNWDLFDLIGHPAADSHEGSIAIPRIVRRARTMRHQPDGYVRSFIDNKLVHEIEDDTITEQLPFNVKCPTEFAEVSIVEPAELSHLNVAEPSCSDPEWSAPYEEVCLPRFRAPAGDSNLSGLVLDSPRFTTSSTGDDPWVLPSPASVCSIPSISSPNPFRLTASGDWHNEETPSTPSTPDIKTTEKAFEGWVRRRKTAKELFAKEVTNKWPKCWMCLRGPFLNIYPNQFTRRADMIINIAKCTVSDETELKTSKKFVFRLSRPPMEHHFSCYNQTDMRTWIHKIKLASDMYGAQNRGMSKCSVPKNGFKGRFGHFMIVYLWNHHAEEIHYPLIAQTRKRGDTLPLS